MLIRNKIIWFTIIGYIFFWASFIINNASNRPLLDDYDSILSFLISVKESDSVINIARLLILPHNEHPLLFSRLITLIAYLLFQSINFTYLIIIANSLLLGVFFLLYKMEVKNSPKILFLCVALLLLNCCGDTISIWPMAALQHYSSIALTIFTFAAFSSTNRHNQRLGIPLLYMTALSGGANIFICPLLIAMHLFKKDLRLALWIFIHSCIVFATIWYFKIGNGQHSYVDNLDLLKMTEFFLLFLGNPIKHVTFSITLGLFVIIAFLYSIKIKAHINNPVYFYSSFYAILVAASATISRIHYGSEYALEPKYTPYSLLCIISLILIISHHTPPTKKTLRLVFFSVITVFSIFLSLNSWFTNKTKIEDLSNIDFIIYPDQNIANTILKKAQAYHIYIGERHLSNYPK